MTVMNTKSEDTALYCQICGGSGCDNVTTECPACLGDGLDHSLELRAEVKRLKRSDRIGSELLGQTRIDLSNALAKNERLSDANASLRVSNDNLRSLLAQSAHGEVERLRAALARFGNHLMTCRFFADLDKAACDCGFTACQT